MTLSNKCLWNHPSLIIKNILNLKDDFRDNSLIFYD